MPKMKFYNGTSWVTLDANDADTVDGKHAADFALATHTHTEYALASHTHDDRYYTETEVNNLLAGKANTSHGNHVPTTQTANNAVFLRNDNTWATVTPANIGAAAASHTHTEYALVSHGNHVPAVQTANNAVYLRNDNTWQTITPSDIGAATDTHTHQIAPLAVTVGPSSYPVGVSTFTVENDTAWPASIGVVTTIYHNTNRAAQWLNEKSGAMRMFYRTADAALTNGWTAWKQVAATGDKASDSDKLDGLDSTQFLRSDTSDTMSGTLTVTSVVATSGTDVTATSTGHALQAGVSTTLNIAIDGNEIQARNNGAISDLNLNALGGTVNMGGHADVTGNLTVGALLNSANPKSECTAGTGTASLSANVDYTVPFTGATGWSNGTFTAPNTGFYVIGALIYMNHGVNQTTSVKVFHNGVQTVVADTYYNSSGVIVNKGMHAVFARQLDAGATIKFAVFPTVGCQMNRDHTQAFAVKIS